MLIVAGFLGVWLLLCTTLVLAPYQSVEDASTVSWLAAAFVSITAVAAWGVSAGSRVTASMPARWRGEPMLWSLLCASAIGVALHIYAKVVLQGIDYSDGIAAAREQWLAAGNDRDGVSSLASVFGYLLSSLHFAATFLLLRHWENLRRARALTILFSILLLNLLFFGVIGSRSGAIAFLALAFVVMCLRQLKGQSFLPPLLGRARKPFWLIVAFVPLAYAMLLFSERVGGYDGYQPQPSTSEINLPTGDEALSSDVYLLKLVLRIGGEPSADLPDYLSLPRDIRRLANYMLLCGIYVSHTQWTWAFVMTLPERPGFASAGLLAQVLLPIGLLQADSLKKADLGFSNLSLPAALWYDGGTIGLVLSAVVLGTLTGWLIRRCRQDCPLFLELAYCLAGITLILSPIASLGAFLPGPFIIFALGLLAIPSLFEALWCRIKRLSPKSTNAKQ